MNGISLDHATHIKMVSDLDLFGYETIHTNDRMEMLPVMEMKQLGVEWRGRENPSLKFSWVI